MSHKTADGRRYELSRIGLADGREPGGAIVLAPRGELAVAPAGDLVQAGPRLVAGGRVAVDDDDREGFSAGAEQFDSDITAERHPRCALGVNEDELFRCAATGAEPASTPASTSPSSPACCSRSSSVDQPGPESRPVVTALLFDSLPSR